MSDVTASWTVAGVPLVTPANVPEVTIRRLDTQAIVAGPSAMTEIGEGQFAFTFAFLTGIEYGIVADGDPTVAGQVAALDRYMYGYLNGTQEVNIETRLDATVSSRATQADILNDATPFPGANIDAAVSSRATQAQIISDATPFPGANIDAAVSSRAAADVAFAGSVWVDAVNGAAGTAFPLGTPTNPVDNIADALTIAVANNLATFIIMSQGPFYTPTGAMDQYNLISPIDGNGGIAGYDGSALSHANTKFQGLNLIGDFGGSFIRPSNCTIQGISEATGDFKNCRIQSTIALPIGANFPQLNLEECNFLDFLTPLLDFTTATNVFARIVNGRGVMTIDNCTDAGNTLIIDQFEGRITINASCTAGTITIYGNNVTIVDNSAGATVVDNTITPLGNVTQIQGSTQAATNLRESANLMEIITVDDSTFAPTLTQFEATGIQAAEDDADHFRDRLVIFASPGTLQRQARAITGYTQISATKGLFSVAALTAIPVDGETAVIV